MADYIKELRKLVGPRAINLATASVLVRDEKGRLLMQHRTDDDTWGYPGGIIELGEKVEDAARREVYEETGITPLELQFFGVFSGPEFHYFYPNGDEVYVIDITYLCTRFQGEIRFDGMETQAVAFYDPMNLPEPVNTSCRPILREYMRRNSLEIPRQIESDSSSVR